MNILIKHNKSKRHLFEATDDKTPTSSLIAQMDAIDLNSPRDGGGGEDDDDWDPNVNGGGSPKDDRDLDAQGDPSVAKNVGVL